MIPKFRNFFQSILDELLENEFNDFPEFLSEINLRMSKIYKEKDQLSRDELLK